MPTTHSIREGESVIGLSEQHGLFAPTIWDDPANAELRRKRPHMNELLPGDVVTVPDRRPKEVEKPVDQGHRFRRKGIPALFRLQLFDVEEPRANQAWRLTVDGKAHEGTTDAQGVLELYLPTGSRTGELVVGPDELRLALDFGTVGPVTEPAGVQRRLRNLGYDCPDSGELDDGTRVALAAFQARFGLADSGEADEATLAKLQEVHDAPSRFEGAEAGEAA